MRVQEAIDRLYELAGEHGADFDLAVRLGDTEFPVSGIEFVDDNHESGYVGAAFAIVV